MHHKSMKMDACWSSRGCEADVASRGTGDSVAVMRQHPVVSLCAAGISPCRLALVVWCYRRTLDRPGRATALVATGDGLESALGCWLVSFLFRCACLRGTIRGVGIASNKDVLSSPLRSGSLYNREKCDAVDKCSTCLHSYLKLDVQKCPCFLL